LKSRKKLQQLFAAKKAVYAGDVKLLFLLEHSDKRLVKCGVGLNGRFFKKAVDRNRIKRLLREAYRLQQHELKNIIFQQQKELSIFILYTGKNMPDYHHLYEMIGIILRKLISSLEGLNTENLQ
jgi:ribonuclease P protein component